jgi:predicted amidohydrolase
MIRIAVVQFAPVFANPRENVALITHHIASCAQQGANLVVFPEASLTGYCFSSPEEAREAAVPLESPYLRQIEEACSQTGCGAIVGFAERNNEHLYNSAVFYSSSGLLGVYRKTHLPLLGLDRFAQRGNCLEPFDSPYGKVGILICFDNRFPESARTLALKGAEILCLPTNWPQTAEKNSDWVCPTRAMENRVFFVAANRVGEEKGFRFVGRSKIISPAGEVLASADHTEEALLFADIDPAEARSKHVVIRPSEYELDLWGERRPDLYDVLSSQKEDVGKSSLKESERATL